MKRTLSNPTQKQTSLKKNKPVFIDLSDDDPKPAFVKKSNHVTIDLDFEISIEPTAVFPSNGKMDNESDATVENINHDNNHKDHASSESNNFDSKTNNNITENTNQIRRFSNESTEIISPTRSPLVKNPPLKQASLFDMLSPKIPKVLPAFPTFDSIPNVLHKTQCTLKSWLGIKTETNENVQPQQSPLKATGNNNSVINNKYKDHASKGNNNDYFGQPPSNRDGYPQFFKRIPSTDFLVDCFANKYSKPEKPIFFLTHFHSDHYSRLSSTFNWGSIYCSEVTANLVSLKLRVNSTYLKAFPLNTPFMVSGVEVTFIDANHCPGSVMIVFKMPNGTTHLHTGDFRYLSTLQDHIICRSLNIQNLYLDTTYCDPQYQFPPQAQIINQCIDLIKNDVKRADTIIIFGTYTIGKERVFIEAALKYQCKIFVTSAKYKILECLNYPPNIMRLFTKKASEAKFHVLSLFEISLDKITNYLKEQAWPVSRAVGIKPTGWSYSKSAQKPKKHMTKDETVTTWDLPYSEHSSFNELQAFVKHVNAKFIIPTVNNYSADSTKEIIRLLSPI